MSAPQGAPRAGRPPKLDSEGRATDERLLLAAADACVEHGFEGVTLTDIAKRADVSTPAIYNHFSSKSELMVEACRAALKRFGGNDFSLVNSPRQAVRTYLSPEFARQRVLLLELNLAATRHPEVTELMGAWHRDLADKWNELTGITPEQVKLTAMLFLGFAGFDAVAAMPADAQAVAAEADELIDVIFPHVDG